MIRIACIDCGLLVWAQSSDVVDPRCQACMTAFDKARTERMRAKSLDAAAWFYGSSFNSR